MRTDDTVLLNHWLGKTKIAWWHYSIRAAERITEAPRLSADDYSSKFDTLLHIARIPTSVRGVRITTTPFFSSSPFGFTMTIGNGIEGIVIGTTSLVGLIDRLLQLKDNPRYPLSMLACQSASGFQWPITQAIRLQPDARRQFGIDFLDRFCLIALSGKQIYSETIDGSSRLRTVPIIFARQRGIWTHRLWCDHKPLHLPRLSSAAITGVVGHHAAFLAAATAIESQPNDCDSRQEPNRLMISAGTKIADAVRSSYVPKGYHIEGTEVELLQGQISVPKILVSPTHHFPGHSPNVSPLTETDIGPAGFPINE